MQTIEQNAVCGNQNAGTTNWNLHSVFVDDYTLYCWAERRCLKYKVPTKAVRILRHIDFVYGIPLLLAITPDWKIEYRIAGQNHVVHDESFDLIPGTKRTKRDFVSAFVEIHFLTVVVYAFVIQWAWPICRSHTVKFDEHSLVNKLSTKTIANIHVFDMLQTDKVRAQREFSIFFMHGCCLNCTEHLAPPTASD